MYHIVASSLFIVTPIKVLFRFMFMNKGASIVKNWTPPYIYTYMVLIGYEQEEHHYFEDFCHYGGLNV